MAEEHAKAEHESKTTNEEHKHAVTHMKSPPSSPPGPYGDRRSVGSSVAAFITVLLLVIGIIALVLWLIYRPHKPRFTVVGAAVYGLNATAPPPLISLSVQFAVIARNPNRRVSMSYDRLAMYATYRDHMVTAPLALPPLHLPEKTTVVIAPVMGGVGIPAPPEVVNGLRMDHSYGVVSLRVVLIGKLKYKAGGIKTRRYGVNVKCDVLLGTKSGISGQVPLLSPSTCIVDV